MSTNFKTHRVLDKTYTEEEGQGMFVGTLSECEKFLEEQYYPIGMEVVPMTSEERKIYNDCDDKGYFDRNEKVELEIDAQFDDYERMKISLKG